MITSRTIFSYLDASYLDILTFVPKLVLTPDILTCSWGLSGFSRPCSIIARDAKGANYDTLLNFSTYFPDCLLSLSTYVRGGKGADVGGL